MSFCAHAISPHSYVPWMQIGPALARVFSLKAASAEEERLYAKRKRSSLRLLSDLMVCGVCPPGTQPLLGIVQVISGMICWCVASGVQGFRCQEFRSQGFRCQGFRRQGFKCQGFRCQGFRGCKIASWEKDRLHGMERYTRREGDFLSSALGTFNGSPICFILSDFMILTGPPC
jgi:hypothetical protein